MHLIIYGPEGSGKGTQAEFLGQRLKLPVLTSGDLVREAAKMDKGHLGEICRNALTIGTYVPDEEIFQLWKNKLKSEEAKKGFILDGFPRNKHQAEFLFTEIDKLGYSIDKLIYLKLTNEESVKRLVLRNRKLFAGSNISHDTPERINKRLEVYRKMEKEILDYFSEKNLVLEIDGSRTKEEVFEDITEKLKNQ